VHILRQYVTWIRQFLDKHRVPYRLATIHDFGYALCEIAPKAEMTTTPSLAKGRGEPRAAVLAPTSERRPVHSRAGFI
jgi:hypothetical protein